ncbi:response regulator [Microbaculum marinum]|uniref:Regulatory protein VirG n=1 Tax=Microbaculum marinum TaxID=1764581 RepID=A0AAW9RTR0_9HYPH
MIAGTELAAEPGVRPAGAAERTPHVVVVDDESEIREMLREYLSLKGFRVDCVEGGAALRRLIAEDPADLVLLDIAMPEEDGLSIARYLNANHDSAIVMLTAAGDVVDRIIGLEMGADDYLPKPVDLRELLARIKAVLRRGTRSNTGPANDNGPRMVRFGDCRLDIEAHRLQDAEGMDIPITSMEFDLLKAFAEHPNRVLSRDQLLDLAHNRGWEPFDRSIDIRIARLRRKVEPDPAKPQVIRTVRGAGYMFAMGRAG